MKPALMCILFFFLFLTQSVFPQDTWNSYLNMVLNVPVESERMKLLDDLMIQTGQQFPVYSRPVTHKEWQRYINHIYSDHRDDISPALREKIEDYLPDLRFQEDWHFELYGRTVPEIVYSTKGNTNYLTRYEKRSPLFRLNYEASRDTNFGFSIRMNVNNYQPVYTVTGNKTNFPKDPWEDLDFRVFHKAYFSYQTPQAMITLQLGRDNLYWGSGNKASLLLSDNVPYYDMFKFALWFNEIKFSVIYASLTDFEPQNQFKGSYNDVSGLDKPEKNMLVQRVEYTLSSKINFGLSYMKIIYGRSPKLGDINPLIYQHNLFKDYQNSLASADVTASVIPGVVLYGEIASDEINFSGDVKKDGSDPTALSYQFGARVYAGGLFYKAEYVHIAPFMYNHFHYLGRAIEIDGVRYYGLPQRFITARAMGHYYQPDSRNYSLLIERVVNKFLRLGLSAESRNYGEINLSTPFPPAGYKAKDSPSGVVEKAAIAGFHASYFSLMFLSDLNIYYSKYNNFKNIAGNDFSAWEFQFSIGYRFDLL